MADQGGRPGDRAGHGGRIARRAARQHLREPPAEHERLELQHPVKQPEDAEGELERAAGLEARESLLSNGSRRHVPGGEALVHVPASLRFGMQNY